MGGERFETTQPEAYLFGENQDLNFLGSKPVPFPYPAPQANEPTKTLKSLVNIRRDSVRFVKVTEEPPKDGDDTQTDNANTEIITPSTTKYNIEFTFDSDVKCAITVYYFSREEIENKKLVYHPRDPSMNSETFHYKRGANQTFNQSTHIIDPSVYPEEEWLFNPDKEVVPVAIHCVVEDEDFLGHSHVTLAVVEKTTEGGFTLKALKQKQMVDGLCYLLQEIYGIENKNTDRAKDDDIDDSGSECVICMSETRDTIILSCRHLCLCSVCAESLRYQANNCPICRAPFRALLQIRAMKKKTSNIALPTSPSVQGDAVSGDPSLAQENLPPGYEPVSLIEALNGSSAPAPHSTLHSMHPDGENPGLDMLLAGNSTLRSTISSNLTSPDQSPVIKTRRKLQRRPSQTSVHSRRSVGSHPDLEAEGASGAGDERRASTPVVCMTEQAPDPSKSPSSSHKSLTPPVKFSGGKSYEPTDAVEIVDEVQASKKYPAMTRCDDSDPEDAVEGTSRTADDDDDVPEEIEADEDNVDYDEALAYPAAHTSVLYDSHIKQQDDDDCSILPLSLLDPPSLPNTPADGSSYSSTNSGHGLLSQNISSAEDRPPSPDTLES